MTEASASSIPTGNVGQENGFPKTGQHVVDFINYLVRKWWVFLIVGLLAAIAGYWYAAKQKVKYQSNLTFVLDQAGGDGGISNAVNLAAQLGLNINTGSDLFFGDNILEIIKSRRMVEKVMLSVDTFSGKPYTLIEYLLHVIPGNMQMETDKRDSIHFLPNQSRSSFSYAQDSVLYNTFMDFANFNIEADRPDKKLSIFSVRITSFDEKFSKIFIDHLIHEADSFYTEISSKKERETLEILEHRVATMKGNLSASISNRAATQDANLNSALASAQAPLQKQQANITVYAGAYGEMFKNLELARFQYLKKIPLIQIIDEANYPMKKIKTGKLKTAAIFSLAAVFVVIFILWIIRVYKNVM